MISSISFCVISHGHGEGIIHRAIASILKQRLFNQEILVWGELPLAHNIKIFQSDGWSESGEWNRIRNMLCSKTTKDFIVLMADSIELSDGWYEAIKDADYFDIVGSRIATNDGTRAVDWAYQVKLGSSIFAYPLNYDEWTTRAYVSGNLMILRKRAWEWIKFNERLLGGDGDDIDFCLRATRAGFRIGVIPQARATYNLGNSGMTSDITFERSQKIVLEFETALAAGKDALKAGDYESALMHLKKAAEIVPGDPVTLALIGWAYYFTGRYDSALEMLDKAVAIDPANHYALRGRGWAFLQSGVHQEAVIDLKKALDLVNPQHRDDWVETMRGVSWANYHAGDFDDAMQYFKTLIQSSRSDEADLLQDVYRGLGWCCYRQGMLSEATGYFEKALSNINPRNRELLRDAKHGLELATLGQAGTVAVQSYAGYPSVELTRTRPSAAPMDWRRSFVSGLKAAIRKILKW